MLESGSSPAKRLFPVGRRNGRDKSAALGMDRDEHLFSRYGEWRRGKDNERDDLCVEDVRQKRRH